MNFDSSSRPALLGGTPVRAGGPPDWPVPDDDVRRALEAAYADSTWGKYHGGNVERLESEIACYHGVQFAWSCSSGTFAVELALRALKVGSGDEVIAAAYDYGGNFRSILAVGARPVLVDIDPGNWNIASDQVERGIGSSTRAIIVSHLHGGIAPIRQIVELARRHGLPVIEDAAQATGALIEGRRAGTWGDVGTLSFGGSKLLTAGRGGCLVTDNPEIHHRAKLYCHRGNDVFPLSELQAAVLAPQLAKLDQRNRVRTERVRKLLELLAGSPGLTPLRNSAADVHPAFYKLGFQFDPSALGGLSRDRFVEAVRAEGVALDTGFRSLHVGRSASRFKRVGNLALAEKAHHCTVVLHHPVLLRDEDEVAQVAHAVIKIIRHCHELRS